MLDFLSEKTRDSQELQNFDALVEHTCFCAISPDQRPNYVKTAAQALKPAALFIGILFLGEEEQNDGPPWTTPLKEFRDLFSPYFEIQKLTPVAPELSAHSRPETLAELRRR